MRVIARIVFSILFISAIFSPLHAQNDATVFNVVKMDIAVDGRTIGKPEFIMQLGSTAVAEYAKVEGYSLKVNLNDTNSIDGKTRVVDYELYLPEQDRWVLNARPKIQTELNQSNQMTFLSRSGRNVDIKISVHDNFKPTAGATYGKNKCTAVKIAAWKADMSKPVSYARSRRRPCNTDQQTNAATSVVGFDAVAPVASAVMTAMCARGRDAARNREMTCAA